jgi:hypothetical protein
MGIDFIAADAVAVVSAHEPVAELAPHADARRHCAAGHIVAVISAGD